MATKHSADYEWLRVAEKFEFLSIELQKALLQPEGKKCFLIGSLEDLIEKISIFEEAAKKLGMKMNKSKT